MNAAVLVLFTLTGLAVGLLHFLSLHRNVTLYLAGEHGRLAIGLQVGRLGLSVGMLVIAARQGAAPLLLAAGGFLLARAAVLTWQDRIFPSHEGPPSSNPIQQGPAP